LGPGDQRRHHSNGHAGQAEEAQRIIIGGYKKLGLDPARMKYIVLTHARTIISVAPSTAGHVSPAHIDERA